MGKHHEENNFTKDGDPKFYNKDGSLTVYALACGYIQWWSVDTIKVKLWMEASTFHVSSRDENSSEPADWVVYESLTTARAAFRNRVREARK